MIVKYQHNEESNGLMQVFVNKMADAEIRDMAERIAEFNRMMQEEAENE